MNPMYDQQSRHRQLAQAHRQQAQFHHQQAAFHHHQASTYEQYAGQQQVNQPVYTPATAYAGYTGQPMAGPVMPGQVITGQSVTGAGMSVYANQSVQSAWNNPRYTASNDQVSPAALVFHGHISPEAMRSLQEFYHPYNQQRSATTITAPMSAHAAQATDNAHAVHYTGSRYYNT